MSEVANEDVNFCTRELGSKSLDRRLMKEIMAKDADFWTRELESKSSDR